MPSRALAVKAVLCTTSTSSCGSRPSCRWSGTGSTVVAHSSHGFIRVSASLFRRASTSFDESFRRHHHNSVPMDATLAKIFANNSQWATAVNDADPGFFERSAKGQTPKVRCRSVLASQSQTCVHRYHIPIRVRVHARRCSGSDVPTPVSPKVSSLPPPQATYSFIATSPSELRPPCFHLPPIAILYASPAALSTLTRFTYSQIHPDDDSALAVITYSVGHLRNIDHTHSIEHSASPFTPHPTPFGLIVLL
jgi:hypothetical protein